MVFIAPEMEFPYHSTNPVVLQQTGSDESRSGSSGHPTVFSSNVPAKATWTSSVDPKTSLIGKEAFKDAKGS